MTHRRLRRGQAAEDAAARYLARGGYRLLARNWRSPVGELDVVAVDGATLVFVEVKARRTVDEALEAVDLRKQRKLVAVAFDYLRRNGLVGCPTRFDVVAVEVASLACTHVENAFDCP